MTAGLPGGVLPGCLLVVLLAAGGGGVGLCVRRSQLSPGRGQLTTLSATTLILAAVYWPWALINMLSFFDLGILTFFLALAASILGLWAPRAATSRAARVYRCFGPTACGFVTVNYLLGILGVLPLGQIGRMIYFGFGAIVWTILAVLAWRTATKTISEFVVEAEQKAEQKESA